jgi:hypothetical protein
VATAGVPVTRARRMILALEGMSEGRSYGMPSLLLHGKFFARFRDDDTVLVLQLGSIEDRDFLMRAHPRAFFFTEHYRNYPAVLVRLADVRTDTLREVVAEAWRELSERRVPRPRKRA